MMISALAEVAGHSTAPWYVAVPIIVVVIGLRAWQSRRRGPGRRGQNGGGGNPFGGGGNDPSDGQGGAE